MGIVPAPDPGVHPESRVWDWGQNSIPKHPWETGITQESGNKPGFFLLGKLPGRRAAATFRLFRAIFWEFWPFQGTSAQAGPDGREWGEIRELCLGFPTSQPRSRLSRRFLGMDPGALRHSRHSRPWDIGIGIDPQGPLPTQSMNFGNQGPLPNRSGNFGNVPAPRKTPGSTPGIGITPGCEVRVQGWEWNSWITHGPVMDNPWITHG